MVDGDVDKTLEEGGTQSIHAGLPKRSQDGQDVADADEVVAVEVGAVGVVEDEAGAIIDGGVGVVVDGEGVCAAEDVIAVADAVREARSAADAAFVQF